MKVSQPFDGSHVLMGERRETIGGLHVLSVAVYASPEFKTIK